MYCINCGKKIEGRNVYCDECAASLNIQQQKDEPVADYKYPENPLPVYQLDEEPAPVQPPVEEPETFRLNTTVTEPEKLKKNKKRPAIFPIVAAVLVVAIVVSAVLCWGPIKSFYLRNLGSAESYLQHVEENSANDMVSSVTGAYGSILESISASANQASKGRVHIQFGEELLDILGTALEDSGMGLDTDLSWLSDLLITVYSANEEDKMQLDMGLGLGNTTVATMSLLMEIAKGEMYVGIPELNEEYLYVDMEQMGVDIDSLMGSRETIGDLEELLISEEKMNEILNKYVQIILDAMQEAEKGTENVEVEGITQKLNVISCTLTEEDILNIAVAILEDVQKDEELLEMVIGIVDQFAVGSVVDFEEIYDPDTDSYYYEPVYEDIDAEEIVTEGIEDALDALDDMIDDADKDNVVHITTYVDNKDQIAGRHIVIEGEDMDDVELRYITVWKDDEFAFEAELADTLEIVGTGEREKDLISGVYEISADGMDILTLEVEDYHEKSAEEGYLQGTFLIRPDDDVMEELLNDIENSAIGMMVNISDPGLKLSFNCSENKQEVSFGIVLGDSLLLGYTVSSEVTEMEEISMPKDAVDMNDASALEDWLMALDLDALVDNLGEAGVPEDYLELLEQVLDSLGNSYSDEAYPDTEYYG